jgi:sodium pump decarboxylase gamma subunit
MVDDINFFPKDSLGGLMTIAEMFGQSGVLALLGMAVVFSFLIILIISMDIVAKLIRAMGWDYDVNPKKPAAVAGASVNDAAVVAAVTAAVNEHRKNNA